MNNSRKSRTENNKQNSKATKQRNKAKGRRQNSSNESIRSRRQSRHRTTLYSSQDSSSDQDNRSTLKRKEIKVDSYSGNAAIDAYLAQFQLATKRNKWSRKDWAEELALRLKGEARNLILPDSRSKVPTYKELNRCEIAIQFWNS